MYVNAPFICSFSSILLYSIGDIYLISQHLYGHVMCIIIYWSLALPSLLVLQEGQQIGKKLTNHDLWPFLCSVRGRSSFARSTTSKCCVYLVLQLVGLFLQYRRASPFFVLSQRSSLPVLER